MKSASIVDYSTVYGMYEYEGREHQTLKQSMPCSTLDSSTVLCTHMRVASQLKRKGEEKIEETQATDLSTNSRDQYLSIAQSRTHNREEWRKEKGGYRLFCSVLYEKRCTRANARARTVFKDDQQRSHQIAHSLHVADVAVHPHVPAQERGE